MALVVCTCCQCKKILQNILHEKKNFISKFIKNYRNTKSKYYLIIMSLWMIENVPPSNHCFMGDMNDIS